uniref:Uncharacterized protein n=1 Tax=Meloidogyne enterolobii TaxID=390850 RepID=A0A6V7XP14_MELEN|nr:unnamed protein product [Meloidogyne enterolobii]
MSNESVNFDLKLKKKMIKQMNIMGEINWQLKVEVGELENKNLVLEKQAKKANENNEELNKTINKLLVELEKSKKEKDLVKNLKLKLN